MIRLQVRLDAGEIRGGQSRLAPGPPRAFEADPASRGELFRPAIDRLAVDAHATGDLRLGGRYQLEGNAGGSGSMRARVSDEDVIVLPFLVFIAESLCLQIEHRAIAAILRHQLVVRAELDNLAVLEHADAIRVTNR